MTKRKLRFLNYVFVISGTEMKMIRAWGVFNFREMIAHVNSNKKFQDFTITFSLSVTCLSSSRSELACLSAHSRENCDTSWYADTIMLTKLFDCHFSALQDSVHIFPNITLRFEEISMSCITFYMDHKKDRVIMIRKAFRQSFSYNICKKYNSLPIELWAHLLCVQ